MKNNILLCFFFLLCNFVLAEDNEILDEIVNKYEKISTFSANIVQKSTWEELDTVIEYSGKIFYNQDNILISYPNEEQTILVKKDTVYVLNKKNKQLIISSNSFFNLRISFLLKTFYNSLSKIENSNKHGSYSLFFTLDSAMIEKYSLMKATIKFSKDFKLQEIKFTNLNNNSISYFFFKPLIDEKISDEVFKFKFSSDLEIINLFEEK